MPIEYRRRPVASTKLRAARRTVELSLKYFDNDKKFQKIVKKRALQVSALSVKILYFFAKEFLALATISDLLIRHVVKPSFAELLPLPMIND